MSSLERILYSETRVSNYNETPVVNIHARRDVAQSGSARDWGSRGRRFESGRPDHPFPSNR